MLLFDRVSRFAIEDNADDNAIRAGRELDIGLSIAERVFDPLVLDDLGIGAGEVKADAAVFGFHPGREGAALPQVDRRLGCIPIVGRSVPLHDVGGRRIGLPDLIDGGRDAGFDGDPESYCSSLILEIEVAT
ncbi:hypothetical protein GGD62_003430 [Bradyrhizobium sp. ERR14]|nr:hypothetical protein [Bradyrhizobium sp. ERR14]